MIRVFDTLCTNAQDGAELARIRLPLSVADTGGGIPPSSLPYIFEPFYTTKSAGEGTGLGLATVYGILKQNNSFIYAESSDSQPTTFTVFFPQAEKEC